MKILAIFYGFIFCFFAKNIELKNESYRVFWNSSRNIADYTIHEINFNANITNVSPKRPSYKIDKRVTNNYPPKNYDRGHLVPAGDMRWNEKSYNETFLSSNLVPQRPELNRGKWFDLEKIIRQKIQPNQNFQIITGTLFARDNSSQIPDAFYKVIYDAQSKKSVSYLFANKAAEKNLQEYQITLKVLKTLTTNEFLPANQTDTTFLFGNNPLYLIIFIIFSFFTIFYIEYRKIWH